jgi:hypothetical protein
VAGGRSRAWHASAAPASQARGAAPPRHMRLGAQRVPGRAWVIRPPQTPLPRSDGWPASPPTSLRPCRRCRSARRTHTPTRCASRPAATRTSAISCRRGPLQSWLEPPPTTCRSPRPRIGATRAYLPLTMST